MLRIVAIRQCHLYLWSFLLLKHCSVEKGAHFLLLKQCSVEKGAYFLLLK